MPVDQQYLSGYFSTKRYNYVGQERNPVRREGGARGKLTTPQRRHNTAGARKVQFLWGVAKPGNLRRTWPNVRSPRTLLAALHLEFNSLAFFQSIKVQFLKTAAVEKHLLPICGPNEAKTAVADDSLDCALHKHLCLRMGTFVAGQSTWIRLPVKLPHLRLAATLPARKFFVKGMKRVRPRRRQYVTVWPLAEAKTNFSVTSVPLKPQHRGRGASERPRCCGSAGHRGQGGTTHKRRNPRAQRANSVFVVQCPKYAQGFCRRNACRTASRFS